MWIWWLTAAAAGAWMQPGHRVGLLHRRYALLQWTVLQSGCSACMRIRGTADRRTRHPHAVTICKIVAAYWINSAWHARWLSVAVHWLWHSGSPSPPLTDCFRYILTGKQRWRRQVRASRHRLHLTDVARRLQICRSLFSLSTVYMRAGLLETVAVGISP